MIRESTGASHPKSAIRGCIDLGSSYFRLLVIEGQPPEGPDAGTGALAVRREAREFVGWGADLVSRGEVTPALQAQAIRSLRSLLEASREAGCERPALVGTNTLRSARNAPELRTRLEEDCGLSVRILSQREEAELAFAGARIFRPLDEKICLIDVGGTSCQMSWGTGAGMEGFRGIQGGVHGAHRAILGEESSKPLLAGFIRSFDIAAFARPSARSRRIRLPDGYGQSTMLVTGGTAVSLAILARYVRGFGARFREMERIGLDDFPRLRAAIADLLEGKEPEGQAFDAPRLMLLPAGTIAVETLLIDLGVREFAVTARDLRWGVVLAGETTGS